jgi:hypothetical protein
MTPSVLLLEALHPFFFVWFGCGWGRGEEEGSAQE